MEKAADGESNNYSPQSAPPPRETTRTLNFNRGNIFVIGFGWNTNNYGGNYDFDLDASAFLLADNGKVIDQDEFIFFNNPKHWSGAVKHMGDDIIYKGDDEEITVDLSRVPENVSKIDFVVTIYYAEERRQNFGMLSDVFIRVIDKKTNEIIIHHDLGEDFSFKTGVIVGEFYRNRGEWKFKPISYGFTGGLGAISRNYGVYV